MTDPYAPESETNALIQPDTRTPAERELARLLTPFGYFKAEPFGWTDCAETDEGAIALYTAPPAAPVQEPTLQEQLDDALSSLHFYKRRADALQQWQSEMRDPERTIVCDILANGCTLEPAGDRYTIPPAAGAAAGAAAKAAAWAAARDAAGAAAGAAARDAAGAAAGAAARDAAWAAAGAAQKQELLRICALIDAPPAQPAAPIKPVVPADANINQRISFVAGWRAAEAAHGITAKKGGEA